ncbi:MAG: hemerythrin domain-containing protein [Planctomycetes bacterium]|nr:hemerythrin domain-containing protein [Planctomycetota bacterium]
MTQGSQGDGGRKGRGPRSSPGPTLSPSVDLDRNLPLEHPLRLFLAEHALMRRLADELDEYCSRLARNRGNRIENLAKIRGLALELQSASRAHHRREEEALFGQLRARGVHGPPDVLETEHDDFDQLEADLVRLAAELQLAPQADPTALFQAASSLIALSRSHIHRENEVLFPMVLELFTRDGIWDEVQRVSDTIPSSTSEDES